MHIKRTLQQTKSGICLAMTSKTEPQHLNPRSAANRLAIVMRSLQNHLILWVRALPILFVMVKGRHFHFWGAMNSQSCSHFPVRPTFEVQFNMSFDCNARAEIFTQYACQFLKFLRNPFKYSVLKVHVSCMCHIYQHWMNYCYCCVA